MKSNRSRKDELRRISARYPRVIEWSQEDGCYVGSAPPLIGHCCDGATEPKVAAKLAMIIDDKKVALKAMACGESLNQLVADVLSKA